MCEGCWQEYGCPRIATEQTKTVAEMVRRLYAMPDGCAGGNLHIYTDDWNLEDEFFERPALEIYHTYSNEQLALERDIYLRLRAMSVADRAASLALEAGYFAAGEGEGQ